MPRVRLPAKPDRCLNDAEDVGNLEGLQRIGQLVVLDQVGAERLDLLVPPRCQYAAHLIREVSFQIPRRCHVDVGSACPACVRADAG